MPPTLLSITETISEWILAALATTGSILLGVAGIVGRNHKRSKRNERRLEGDPDDPNHDGVLEIASDTRDRLEHLEERMAEQHAEVLERVEELSEDVNGGGETDGG